MENGKAAPETPEDKQPQARCWIDQGMLRVEVPLFMLNGEFIAFGILHKATQLVAAFFRHIEREAQKDAELRNKIITPAGMPRPH